MPKINPEIEAFARIKVIGIGGSGNNAVAHMVNNKVSGVEFIAMNTDSQDLHHCPAPKKIHIGKNLTRGLGTGMNPEVGRKAAEETIEEVQGVLKGADMVFIACGMGGGTGTGAAPIIAKTSKEQGILTVGVVTKPFFFEGSARMRIAEEGLEELRKNVDALIVIPNDRLLGIVDKDTSCSSAFAMCDEVLRQAVEGISDLITTPGIINVDFADIKSIMQNAGSALMGIGSATGENRAALAARAAINSPLLDVSIQGARGVLFAIAGGEDMSMYEIQEAAKVITELIDKDAKVIFGTIRDDKLKKNEIRVTVIASGFPDVAGKRPATGFGSFRDEIKQAAGFTPVTPTSETVTSEKGAIYNEIRPPVKKTEPIKTTINIRSESRTEPAKQGKDDEEDWSSIPAFLRRNKK